MENEFKGMIIVEAIIPKKAADIISKRAEQDCVKFNVECGRVILAGLEAHRGTLPKDSQKS